jgi:hypothetical protein
MEVRIWDNINDCMRFEEKYPKIKIKEIILLFEWADE